MLGRLPDPLSLDIVVMSLDENVMAVHVPDRKAYYLLSNRWFCELCLTWTESCVTRLELALRFAARAQEHLEVRVSQGRSLPPP